MPGRIYADAVNAGDLNIPGMPLFTEHVTGQINVTTDPSNVPPYLVGSGVIFSNQLTPTIYGVGVTAAAYTINEQSSDGLGYTLTMDTNGTQFDAVSVIPLYITQPQMNPLWMHAVRLDDVADVNFLVGWGAQTGSLDPSANYFMVQFATSRGDLNFQIAYRAGGAQVLIDTGIAPSADTFYEILTQCNADGSLTATINALQVGASVAERTQLYTTTISSGQPTTFTTVTNAVTMLAQVAAVKQLTYFRGAVAAQIGKAA